MNDNKQSVIKTINLEHKQAKSKIIEALSFLEQNKIQDILEWIKKIINVENNFNFVNMYLISKNEVIYDRYDVADTKQETQIIVNTSSKVKKVNESKMVPLFSLEDSNQISNGDNNQINDWNFYSFINLVGATKEIKESRNNLILIQDIRLALMKLFKENNVVITEFEYEEFGLGFMVYNENVKNNQYELFY